MITKSILSMVGLTLLVTIQGAEILAQTEVQGQEDIGKDISIKCPDDWRGETIKLPAPFAPDMKLKGVEVIRFAPGMFKAEQADFFSYVFVFQVDKGQSLNQKVLEREMLAYYRGLSKAVLEDDAEGVDFDAFKIELSMVVPTVKGKSSGTVRYSGKIEWVEPFVTKKKQTLLLEMEVWKDVKSEKPMLFVAASPSKSDAKIWKQMRSIRDKTVSASNKK